MDKTYCGYVALIGRPNVGKSTLLNYLLGKKLSITSRKPQTTRHKIIGIQTRENKQIIYVDTPGIHLHEESTLNRLMNSVATRVIDDVDIVVFICEALTWSDEDELCADKLKSIKKPLIIALNKLDKVTDQEKLKDYIGMIQEKLPHAQTILISAKRQYHLDELQNMIFTRLPQGPFFYPEDMYTDKSERFLCSEIIREQIFRQTGQEIPYSTNVIIDEFEDKPNIIRISSTIIVERESHKIILIGTKGEKLKNIGQQARLAMEKLLDKKVFLQLWIKVRSGWSDDESTLQKYGYLD